MKELLAVAIIASVIPTMADAAELKVIAGGSMTAPLNKISPEFEKSTGHKLSIHFDSTPNIIARVNAGTPFDVVVLPVDVFKDAAARAHFAPGPTVDIARVGYGVIVRAGAPRPDISTPEAFKQAMLAAPSPGDLQQELVFTSAVAADTKEADATKALIDYLRSPAATTVIGAAGMTPG